MLQLVNKQFKLEDDLMTIPQFRRIWERDPTDNKEEALAYIAFIFHFYNPKSPFYAYVEERRKDEIIQRIFPERMQSIKPQLMEDADVVNAGNIYQELLGLSPYRSVIDTAKQALENISNTLKSTDTPIDKKLDNINKITRGMEELKKAEKYCEEDEINSRVQGRRILKKREV